MHSIQLALQCYATFTSGSYPPALASGDIRNNSIFLKQFIGGTPPNDPYCGLRYNFPLYTGGDICKPADFSPVADPTPLTKCATWAGAAIMPGQILYLTDDGNSPANTQWAMAGQSNTINSGGNWIMYNGSIFCDHN